jgi:hypothetical protein
LKNQVLQFLYFVIFDPTKKPRSEFPDESKVHSVKFFLLITLSILLAAYLLQLCVSVMRYVFPEKSLISNEAAPISESSDLGKYIP